MFESVSVCQRDREKMRGIMEGRESEREHERETKHVCVCERERERERKSKRKHTHLSTEFVLINY